MWRFCVAVSLLTYASAGSPCAHFRSDLGCIDTGNATASVAPTAQPLSTSSAALIVFVAVVGATLFAALCTALIVNKRPTCYHDVPRDPCEPPLQIVYFD